MLVLNGFFRERMCSFLNVIFVVFFDVVQEELPSCTPTPVTVWYKNLFGTQGLFEKQN